MGWSETAKTVPEVPMDTATSPAPRPRPRAAAMLSPVPAETRAPPAVRPAGSAGPSTRGTVGSCPSARRSRSGR